MSKNQLAFALAYPTRKGAAPLATAQPERLAVMKMFEVPTVEDRPATYTGITRARKCRSATPSQSRAL